MSTGAYEWWEECPHEPGKEIHTDDEFSRWKATGVLDPKGNMIYRPPRRIGFYLTPRRKIE